MISPKTCFGMALLAAFVAVGCKSAPVVHLKDPGPAALPAGWETADSPQDGVSIGVPSGWRPGTGRAIMASDLMSSGVDSGAGSDPNAASDPNSGLGAMVNNMQEQSNLEEAKAMEELRKKGTIIHVIDSSRPIPGEERTRYYVKKFTHDSDYPLDEAAADEKEAMKNEEKPETVNLPVGKAIRYYAQFKTIGGDTVTHISYVLADGKVSYVVRFAQTGENPTITGIDRQVMETFRAKPTKD